MSGVVAFADDLARQKDRFEQIIDLAARADAAQVGPNAAAGAAEGVTLLTGEIGAAKDRLAATGITLGLNQREESTRFLRRHLAGGRVDASGILERFDKGRRRNSERVKHAKSHLGGIGRRRGLRQGRRQCRGTSALLQEGDEQVTRIMTGGRRLAQQFRGKTRRPLRVEPTEPGNRLKTHRVGSVAGRQLREPFGARGATERDERLHGRLLPNRIERFGVSFDF